MTVVASASRMPEGMKLEVRNIKFELSEQLSKDWLDNDPFKTAFFISCNVISILSLCSFGQLAFVSLLLYRIHSKTLNEERLNNPF